MKIRQRNTRSTCPALVALGGIVLAACVATQLRPDGADASRHVASYTSSRNYQFINEMRREKRYERWIGRLYRSVGHRDRWALRETAPEFSLHGSTEQGLMVS